MAGSFEEMLRGWETGQIAAIFSKVSGGDRKKLVAILQDQVEVHLVGRTSKLVDKNGRVIPHKDLKNAVCDPDKNFYLVQPRFKTAADYAERLTCFQETFKAGLDITAEFERRSKELIAEIKNQRNLANLLNGVYLSIILPRLGDEVDYGKAMEQIFLPAVKFSYEKQFPGMRFYNWRENELAGKVKIVEGTRHERIVGKMMHDRVVAIYFPNSLQGFSVQASREQLLALPESLLLAGGFDTAAALAMYPDVLAGDWQTPGYDLSALSWQSPDYLLGFEASDDGLYFDSRGALGNASGNFSSGLLFLGSV